MIVVDASAVVEVLLRTSAGDRTTARLLAPDAGLNAPHLIDIEVAHAFRRLAANGKITTERGQEMLSLLADLPIRRHAHLRFLSRIWALRATLQPMTRATSPSPRRSTRRYSRKIDT